MLATIPDHWIAGALAEAQATQPKRKRSTADPNDWRAWLAENFASYTRYDFAPRHAELWDWAVALRRGVRPHPLVAVWPRGGAKSTSAELACCHAGTNGRRRYALYVSETQEQADKHVATIAAALESMGVDRAVNKYGSSKGWRRNRLRTSDGFTIDSLGIDTAARGIKVEDMRPDLIVFDDIDALHDSDLTVQKKLDTITQTILPAGSEDLAVLFVQNLIHQRGVVSRMVSGRADFLVDRIVSGPFKAIEGEFDYEVRDGRYVITGGEPSWAGQSIAACEGFMNTWGARAFMRECQHDVKGDVDGALWTREMIDRTRIRREDVPEMAYVITFLDPSKQGSRDSDECGIVTVGRGVDDHGYVLDDRSIRAMPRKWAERGVRAYYQFGANYLKYENNMGGETVSEVLRATAKDMGVPVPAIHGIPTNVGKLGRAEPASVLYEMGMVHHVGVFPELEDEQVTWDPRTSKSPNRIDALVGALKELGLIDGGGFGFGVV